MQKILQEVRVTADTYILDGDAEITTADIGKGYWLLGFDRGGDCFEMSKIDRKRAKNILNDGDALVNGELDITDLDTATYYYNCNCSDMGVLIVH